MDFDCGTGSSWKCVALCYFIIFLFLWIALSAENKDLWYPLPSDSGKNRNARTRKGMAYAKGEHRDGDTPRESLEKIKIASRYEMNSVKWRRSIIITFFVILVLFPLLYGRLGAPQELITSFFVVYLVVYVSNMYYCEHLTKPASKVVDKNCDYVSDFFSDV